MVEAEEGDNCFWRTACTAMNMMEDFVAINIG